MFSFGGQGQSPKAVGFSSKKPRPRRFGSERRWTNRAERLPWVPRPKKRAFPLRPGVESVGMLRYLRGFGAIKRKCLDDRSLAFCRKVSFGTWKNQNCLVFSSAAEVSL